MPVERIGELYFAIGSRAHEDATAHVQDQANELAQVRAELDALRRRAATLEAETVLLRRACEVADARREVAEVQRDEHAAEIERMTLVMKAHQCDAARAN